MKSLAATALAALLLAVAAASAQAQDYTVTQVPGLYEPPPGSAVPAGPSSASTARIDLPFEFPYFGALYDHFSATIHGYVQFGNDNATIDPGGGVFGFLSPPQPADGACAAVWSTMASGSLGSARVWTAGTAPTRRFIISYEAVRPATGPAVVTFQMKFFETTGNIEFAFGPDSVPTTWNAFSYKQGMDAPGPNDVRAFIPYASAVQTAYPPSDYRIVPATVTITGKMLFERLNATAAGSSGPSSVDPLRGVALDVLYADGRRAGRGSTNATGDFALSLFRGPSSVPVDMYAFLDGSDCSIRPNPAASPLGRKVLTGLRYDTTKDVGTFTVDAASDLSGAFRGPAAVFAAVDRARAWLTAHSAPTIAKANIAFDATSPLATAYFGPTSDPTLRIAGPASPNDDRWDDAVVIRAYGRHVAAVLGTAPTPPFVESFDAITDDGNAFALGFGTFLAAATLGKTTWVDATGTNTAVSVSLEDYIPTTRKGPDVGAWVALAMFDLLDPANESFDTVDGSNAGADRVVQALDALVGVPTAGSFLEGWQAAGHDARGASRVFVAHGLVADDALEPNDELGERAALGAMVLRRDGLVLNAGNEDWFEFTLAETSPDVVADVFFARTTYASTVELEVTTAAGGVVADVVDSGVGPITAGLGTLAAGTYRARIRHLSGKRVPSYTFEVFRRLRMDQAALPSWTVGFPYQRAVPLEGGVGALSFAIEEGSIPPGLAPEAASEQVSGTPTQVGTFDFTLVARDSGFPVHTDAVRQRIVINDVLSLELDGFVAFALGKPVTLTRAHGGGTAPLAVSLTAGALPDGLSLADDDFEFSGTPNAAGSTEITVRGVDAAGSASEDAALAVVCVPLAGAKTPTALAAGRAACGYFIDAVAGSALKATIGTAPKAAKRALAGALIGPGGAPVAGAVVKGGSGKVTFSLSAAPVTGRYFVVAGAAAGDATQLVGTASVSPSKKGKGAVEQLAAGAFVDVPIGALAGAAVAFKAQASKGSSLVLSYIALLGPDGTALPLTGLTSQKGAAILLNAPLAKSGTWTVRIRGSGAGTTAVAYSYTVKQPSGVVYTFD